MKYIPFPVLAGLIAAWIVWMLPFDDLTQPLGASGPGLDFMPFPMFTGLLTMFMIGGGFGDAAHHPHISPSGYVLPAAGAGVYAILALIYGYADSVEASWIVVVSYCIVPASWFAAANFLVLLGWLVRKEKEAFLPSGVWHKP
jgi:hypothetical protein